MAGFRRPATVGRGGMAGRARSPSANRWDYAKEFTGETKSRLRESLSWRDELRLVRGFWRDELRLRLERRWRDGLRVVRRGGLEGRAPSRPGEIDNDRPVFGPVGVSNRVPARGPFDGLTTRQAPTLPPLCSLKTTKTLFRQTGERCGPTGFRFHPVIRLGRRFSRSARDPPLRSRSLLPRRLRPPSRGRRRGRWGRGRPGP